MPLPDRLSEPVAGGFENCTVTSAVKVSSALLAGVPLSLQAEILATLMLETEHVGGGGAIEQAAGAVPALLLVNVHAPSAEKVAVRLMAVPSALMVTPVKVCVPMPKEPTGTEAMPSPLKLSVPVAGASVNVTVTLAVKVSSEGSEVP